MNAGFASREVESLAAQFPPISLAEVMDTAALQTRVDTKYLLTAEQLAVLTTRLRGRFRALNIDERRVFHYDSLYFDTPELGIYRSHHQGRRRRYKCRYRTYVDSGDSLFEVKVKGKRGATIKERLPLASTSGDVLTHQAQAFLNHTLRTHAITVPQVLRPSLRTVYRRATLVDPDTPTRLTLDVDLDFSSPDACVRGPDRVLVECKRSGRSDIDQLLTEVGGRPVRVSKYCVGMALTTPQLRANKWHRLLRREFSDAESAFHAPLG